MRRFGVYALVVVAVGSLGAAGGSLVACGTSGNASSFGNGGNNPDGGGDDDGPSLIDPGTGNGTDGGPCHGLQCAIKTTCANGGSTTITGKIMDPAGANPLYNVLAYVPMYDPADPGSIPQGAGIQPITGGVNFPSGVSCDSCSYLYSGNPIAVGTSGTDGTFTIPNVPSGKNIPVVVQIGKWRTHTTVSTVSDCTANDAGTIKLPSSADGTDPIVSIPQIAISMGIFDSLECLPYRLGIDISEFTSGASSQGHIHIFTGGGKGGGSSPPESSQNLWDSIGDLNKYDVTLFSCEGAETTNANPQILEQYVNYGGRAFVSHYHYAWLAGPLITQATAGYIANDDWGSNLASWNSDDQHGTYNEIVGASINTTLNDGSGTFPKGVAMQSWLQNTGALGTDGVAASDVAVNNPAFDAVVGASNTDTQAWATYDQTNDLGFPTAYFSFNAPVDAQPEADGGAPPYCGRVVFSGLHVGAAAADMTGGIKMPSPTTCSPAPGNLSPQEKVLEFMLFDLSSCVQSDQTAPTSPVTIR